MEQHVPFAHLRHVPAPALLQLYAVNSYICMRVMQRFYNSPPKCTYLNINYMVCRGRRNRRRAPGSRKRLPQGGEIKMFTHDKWVRPHIIPHNKNPLLIINQKGIRQPEKKNGRDVTEVSNKVGNSGSFPKKQTASGNSVPDSWLKFKTEH